MADLEFGFGVATGIAADELASAEEHAEAIAAATIKNRQNSVDLIALYSSRVHKLDANYSIIVRNDIEYFLAAER